MERRPIDSDQLRTLLVIAREGSFSRAAKVLGVSQPTVSARMIALETAVGGRLLTRSRSLATLSDLGRAMLPYAERTIETLNQGIQSVNEMRHGTQGRVTLATLETAAMAYLPSALVSFCRVMPGVSVTVREFLQNTVFRQLEEGAIDLGHVLWPWQQTGGELKPLCVAREPLRFFAAPIHPLSDRKSLSIEDILSADVFHHVASGNTWLSMVGVRAEKGLPSFETSMAVGLQMLRRGIGVALYPEHLVRAEVESGALVLLPVDAPDDHREVALVRHRRAGLMSPAVQAFADALVTAMQAQT